MVEPRKLFDPVLERACLLLDCGSGRSINKDPHMDVAELIRALQREKEV